MAERFSLKDHLFNTKTVGQLAGEYARAVPGFDAERFQEEALAGFEGRELLARLDWLADCIEQQLAPEFDAMADQLEAAMPAKLDPTRSDDDFGQFIHAIPGILAVRHGLETHRVRAMKLLYAATQRFSMEFYIRPFLNRWPDETLVELQQWVEDDNYHVRRLVSEGTRPKLPWAKAVTLTPAQTMPLLDRLHCDPTRYVTRSVANHMNDLSKTVPNHVLDGLNRWQASGRQTAKELDWIKRHALRTLVKSGHAGALSALGYRADAPIVAQLRLKTPRVAIGETLEFSCDIDAKTKTPILVDYRIVFARPEGRSGEKVFKLRQGEVGPKATLKLEKKHRLKASATTFTWHPGPHRLILQVNGVDRAKVDFEVI